MTKLLQGLSHRDALKLEMAIRVAPPRGTGQVVIALQSMGGGCPCGGVHNHGEAALCN